jgi:hypothetical protein
MKQRSKSVILAFTLLGALVLLVPLSASAALISQFGYTVDSGFNNNNGSIHPLLGGSFTFTPNAAISTGAGAISQQGVLQLSYVTNFYSGITATYFRTQSATALFANANTLILRQMTQTGGGYSNGTYNSGLVSQYFETLFQATNAFGLSQSVAQSGFYTWTFQYLTSVSSAITTVFTSGPWSSVYHIGSEVRTTVVPEPSTAILLGGGLVVLATAGSGHRAARRNRKARS